MFGLKWDGIRLRADIAEGQVRLRPRPGRDVAAAFPELHTLGTALGRDAMLDAELVVLTADARPDFDQVRRRLNCLPRTREFTPLPNTGLSVRRLPPR